MSQGEVFPSELLQMCSDTDDFLDWLVSSSGIVCHKVSGVPLNGIKAVLVTYEVGAGDGRGGLKTRADEDEVSPLSQLLWDTHLYLCWHSCLFTTGRVVGTKTCGMDNVFPPDDL